MKRRIIFIAFLFLTAAHSAAAQRVPVRDLSQIRAETRERNRAIEEYDRRNRSVTLASNRNSYPRGKIPGSAVRSYVLAAQAKTEVKVLSVSDGDKLLVDDGTNKTVVRILGIDAPEKGQPGYEEAKKNLSDLLTGKKIVLHYSLHNLKDDEGYFPSRVFLAGKDIGLSLLENGFAWRNENDKFFFEKKDDAGNKLAESKAQSAKIGIWRNEKPQKPWEYREQKLKEAKKTKEKADKN